MMVGELTFKVRAELLETLTNLVEAVRLEDPKNLDVCFADAQHEKIYKYLIKYAYRTPLDKVTKLQHDLERTLDEQSKNESRRRAFAIFLIKRLLKNTESIDF